MTNRLPRTTRLAQVCAFAMAASVLATSAGSDIGPNRVTLTPWCDNSMRVRVQPAARREAAGEEACAESGGKLGKEAMAIIFFSAICANAVLCGHTYVTMERSKYMA